jgi:hypothetical protein
MNYAITNCTIDRLEASIQSTINKDYCGHKFFNAIEIKAYNEDICRVILENDSNFIVLQITSEGIEKIQQVQK